MDGEEGEGAGLEGGEGLEGVGVGDGGVVEAGEGFGVDNANHLGLYLGTPANTPPTEQLGGIEGLPEDGGRLALVGGQVDVAAADGEAVGFTDGGNAYDFEGEVEVSGHASDYDELLGVLLAEVGAVGLDDVEELGDDGGHADEMAGPRDPFVEVGDGAGVDLSFGAGAVHFLGGGGENEGNARFFKHAEVTVKVTGVGGEVLVGAELGGVYEYGGGYSIVLGGGTFDEGHVAAMEVAHGGDKAEGAEGRGPGGSEVGDGVEDLHGG